MNIEEIKAQMAAMLETCKTENRSWNEEERPKYDALKADLVKAQAEQRSADMKAMADAQGTIKAKLASSDEKTYVRSITKGSADVGNKEVTDRLVLAFSTLSPLYQAHGDVQERDNGNTFSFTYFGTANMGAVKAEGAESDEDSDTTAEIKSVSFKTYRAKKVPISQEAIDDFAADVIGTVTKIGMVRCARAFNVDCFKSIKEAFGAVYNGSGVETTAPTYDASEGTAWTMGDFSSMYFELDEEKRIGAKFICNNETAQAIVDLLDVEESTKAEWIGLNKANVLVDNACPDDVVFYGNPTTILAIGRKSNVNLKVLPTDGGYTYEPQPRLAVSLADDTAVVARELAVS